MIYKLIADRIITNVSSNLKLDMEYRDIYAYSLERYLSNIFNIIIFSIVAIVLRVPGEAIVFALFYGPLRKYAGGIHLKTRGGCLIISLLIMTSVIWLSKGLALLTNWKLITFILLLTACFLIYMRAPVSSPGRRLSTETREWHRKRSLWIAGIEGSILLVGILFLNAYGSFVILGVLAVLLEGIFLLPNNRIHDNGFE